MIGIGGLAGGVLGFSLLMGINTYQLLIFIFLISGLVGFSRLALDAHKPLEVYTGFIAGFLIEYLSVAKLIG
jgi:membrane-associated phospholipid phosphatase